MSSLASAVVRDLLRQIPWCLLVVGAVLAWLGFLDLRLAAATDATPQVLTCRSLGEQGPGGNAHVRMTRFRLLTRRFVAEDLWPAVRSTPRQLHLTGNPPLGFWGRAWIPVVPDDHEGVRSGVEPETGDASTPRDVRVLLQTGVLSSRGLDELGERPEIQGTVVNAVESLDGEVRDLLRSAYPGVDVSRCWILDVGRVPEAPGSALAKLLGGLALVSAGLAWFLLAHHLGRPREHPARWRARRALRRADAAAARDGSPAGPSRRRRRPR